MRLIASAIAFSILGSLSALAEPLVSQQDYIDDTGMLKVTLPAGVVEISMNGVEGYGLFIYAGSDEVLMESAHIPRLLKIYQNSALLELPTDTSACPIMFAWVTYDAAGLRASEEFGTCAEDANYETTDTGPVVSMEKPNSPGTTVSYRYDEASGKISEF